MRWEGGGVTLNWHLAAAVPPQSAKQDSSREEHATAEESGMGTLSRVFLRKDGEGGGGHVMIRGGGTHPFDERGGRGGTFCSWLKSSADAASKCGDTGLAAVAVAFSAEGAWGGLSVAAAFMAADSAGLAATHTSLQARRRPCTHSWQLCELRFA